MLGDGLEPVANMLFVTNVIYIQKSLILLAHPSGVEPETFSCWQAREPDSSARRLIIDCEAHGCKVIRLFYGQKAVGQ